MPRQWKDEWKETDRLYFIGPFWQLQWVQKDQKE